MDQVNSRLAALAPPDADSSQVAAAIVRVVDTPKSQRPFRVHIDPANDGAETANAVGDLLREHFYHRIGLDDLLSPAFGSRAHRPQFGSTVIQATRREHGDASPISPVYS